MTGVDLETERLNIFRIKAVAIIAVVFLHFLSIFPEDIYTSNLYGWFFVFINQMARFCVPVFLAVSGYGLVKKYADTKPPVINFLIGRVKKLLPLYLLWSLILMVVFRLNVSWSFGEINLLGSFFDGSIDYHLYFVPIIFQLYVIFSLFPKIRSIKKMFGVLVLVWGLQFVWFWYARYVSLQSGGLTRFFTNDQTQYRLIINWLFYFLLGMVLARINDKRVVVVKSVVWALVCMMLFGLIWAVYDAKVLIGQTNNIIYATSFIRMPVLFYATGFISLMMIFHEKIFRLAVFKSPWFLVIGKYSYVIYLSHTIVLRIFENMIMAQPLTSSVVVAGFLFSAGVVFSRQIV